MAFTPIQLPSHPFTHIALSHNTTSPYLWQPVHLSLPRRHRSTSSSLVETTLLGRSLDSFRLLSSFGLALLPERLTGAASCSTTLKRRRSFHGTRLSTRIRLGVSIVTKGFRRRNFIKYYNAPNNAFERPVTRHTSARVRRAFYSAPSARLKRLRPAAQRER